jgi:hypothetical protein
MISLMKKLIFILSLVAVLPLSTARAQLQAPNDAGVAMGHLHLLVKDVEANKQTRTSVVVVEASCDDRVPGCESWWDAPIAEVSERETVKTARAEYEKAGTRERLFF